MEWQFGTRRDGADDFRNDTRVNDHKPSNNIVVAVLGSLSLEFTRLSQITGNEKYFDGIQRVSECLLPLYDSD
jgi:hypothetical protein